MESEPDPGTGLGLVVVAALLAWLLFVGPCGCFEDPAAEMERWRVRAPYDRRIEVLLPPGQANYANPTQADPVHAWYPIPTYFRDTVTGLCFAAYEGARFSGLAQVPCGVVEGARAKLVAKGWKPGEAPTL